MTLRHRLQGFIWDRGPRFLPLLRRLRRRLSLLRYRWRRRAAALPPRVVAEPAGRGATPVGNPAIAVAAAARDREAACRFLAGQTETSVTPDSGAGAAFCFFYSPELGDLPPTWLEAQLLAAVAEGLLWTVSGWAAPALGAEGAADVYLPEAAPVPGLLRLPVPEARGVPPLLGRAVPHVTSAGRLPGDLQLVQVPMCGRSGPRFLREDVKPGRIVVHRLRSLYDSLKELPAVPGPPTVLFLLPFLAVGGAERLLFDLLAGLGKRYRCLAVTLEPHREELGQTLDECRRYTPYVYTLGDYLPREAHLDALRHLVRRYRVEALMSWNPTALFFEAAAGLRRLHPELRLVSQLFNHEGGWIEHYGPRFVHSVDVHVGVNGRIGRALREERGVPQERCAVVHHGVRVPELPSPEERSKRRRKARRALGLPDGACVVGSFMRLHPQKRPQDVLRVARRLAERREDGFHFLLVGGGPLDAEIDRELAERPLANLTRLPLQSDVEPLYDAVDVCLLPSAYEGLPVFLLEGLARERPCVATAVGDISDLLRDGGGVAVGKVGDVAALAAGLVELRDEERRAAEGRRGRRTVAARFGLESYVRAYEEVLFP